MLNRFVEALPASIERCSVPASKGKRTYQQTLHHNFNKVQSLLALLSCLALLEDVETGQWVQTNGPYGGRVYCFAVNGKNLFAGAEGEVFLSTNDGGSWTTAKAGLTNSYVNSLAVSRTNLYAATNGGVFLSTNYGSNWTPVNAGLTDTSVHSFDPRV